MHLFGLRCAVIAQKIVEKVTELSRLMRPDVLTAAGKPGTRRTELRELPEKPIPMEHEHGGEK